MSIFVKNQNGFTLVELLIALVIFAVGILGVATMQITSIKGNSKGRHITETSNTVADQFEKFMSLGYDNAMFIDDDDDGVSGLDDLADPDGSADIDGDGTDDIFWNVALDYPLVNIKTISAFAYPQGSDKTVKMTFAIADF